MRTTVRLDEHLLGEVKQLAAGRGKTLTSMIEEALREMLARRKQSPAVPARAFPTWGAGGLRPGVDLDNSAALLDLLDRADDSD
jgi:hypothetical protein